MAYDLLKQKYPGAPCAVGARVYDRETACQGYIAPSRVGDDGLRVKFDGETFPRSCNPQRIAYVEAEPLYGDQP